MTPVRAVSARDRGVAERRRRRRRAPSWWGRSAACRWRCRGHGRGACAHTDPWISTPSRSSGRRRPAATTRGTRSGSASPTEGTETRRPGRRDPRSAARRRPRAGRGDAASPTTRCCAVHDAELLEFLRTAADRWAAGPVRRPRRPGAGGALPVPHAGDDRRAAGPPRGRDPRRRRPVRLRHDDAGRPGHLGGGPRGGRLRRPGRATWWPAGRRLAYALCRPPGPPRDAGAASAARATSTTRRSPPRRCATRGAQTVGIVDIDAHQGNGTAAIFYDRADVLYGSVHVDPARRLVPPRRGVRRRDRRRRGRGRDPQPAAPGGHRRRGVAGRGRRARRVGRRRRLRRTWSSRSASTPPPTTPRARCRSPRTATARPAGCSARPGCPAVAVQEGGYHLPTLGGLVAAYLDGHATALAHPGHVQKLVDVDAGALAHHQVRVAVEQPLERVERVGLEDRVAADAPSLAGYAAPTVPAYEHRRAHVGDRRAGPAGPLHPGVHPGLGLLRRSRSPSGPARRRARGRAAGTWSWGPPGSRSILIDVKVRRSEAGCKDELVNGERPAGERDLQATIDALSSPVRREILWMLWDAELAAGEIAAGVHVTAGTVSSHLAALRRAGLVTVRVDGNFRHYRVDRPAMEAVLPLLASSDDKWHAADDLPERAHATASSSSGSPSTPTSGSTRRRRSRRSRTASATRPGSASRSPSRTAGSAPSSSGATRVRGHYEVVAPPDLIAMRWDFDDDVIPVPGGQVVGYLRFLARADGCRVEVHQCAADAEQAEFLTAAWQMVLGRFKQYADLDRRTPREPRPKHRPTGGRGFRASRPPLLPLTREGPPPREHPPGRRRDAPGARPRGRAAGRLPLRGRAGRGAGRAACSCSGSAPTPTSRRGCSRRPTDLVAIGCFCIGTNQVDLAAAAERGIAVFNAPYSNTRSVVELVIGEIIALARRLPEKTERMHEGVWDKSAKGSHEIRGRTLGIVGYGNIGTQLSNLAEALGLRVIFYDTADRLAHGNARRMPTLDALLAEADVVSLHVDGRPGQRRALRGRPVRDDEAALAVHQRLPRHGRRRRGAAREHRVRPHRRRRARRVPGRAQGAGRPVRVGAPRPRQRDPHPARRRLHPGGAGGDRLVRRRQARGVRRRGQHRAVGEPARPSSRRR